MIKKIVFMLILLMCLLTSCISNKNDKGEIIKDVSWLGFSSVRLNGSKVIYIDPVRLKDEQMNIKADIILLSHSHADHFSNYHIKKISTKDTKIFATRSVSGLVKGNGVVSTVSVGDVINVDNITIEVVPAYQFAKMAMHQKNQGFAGFVITMDGKRYYWGGDTALIPEMNEISNIDVAFISLGDGLMTKDQYLEAVKRIDPKAVIAVQHHGIEEDTDFIKKKFRDKFVWIEKSLK